MGKVKCGLVVLIVSGLIHTNNLFNIEVKAETPNEKKVSYSIEDQVRDYMSNLLSSQFSYNIDKIEWRVQNYYSSNIGKYNSSDFRRYEVLKRAARLEMELDGEADTTTICSGGNIDVNGEYASFIIQCWDNGDNEEEKIELKKVGLRWIKIWDPESLMTLSVIIDRMYGGFGEEGVTLLGLLEDSIKYYSNEKTYLELMKKSSKNKDEKEEIELDIEDYNRLIGIYSDLLNYLKSKED